MIDDAIFYIETKASKSTVCLSNIIQDFDSQFTIVNVSGIYLLKNSPQLVMALKIQSQLSIEAVKKKIDDLIERANKADDKVKIFLLAYGEKVSSQPYLSVPHPRLAENIEVVSLACEVAPEFMHPILKLKLSEIMKNMTSKDWGEFFCRGKSLLPRLASKSNLLES